MRPTKHQLRASRKRRIRARINGTAVRPRLTVFSSLTRVYAQLIDDTASKTMASAASPTGKKNIAAATKVGETIAKKAKDLKVTTVVFDRNGRKYHGRIKALADAARAGGLQF
jgi:large subunit ribosomal protein L18